MFWFLFDFGFFHVKGILQVTGDLGCLLVFENETLKSWLESHCGCVAQLLGFICRVIGRPSVSGCVGHSSGTCHISQRGIFWSSAFQALMCTYVVCAYRSDLVGLGWGLGILTSSQFLLMEEGCTSNGTGMWWCWLCAGLFSAQWRNRFRKLVRMVIMSFF